LGSPRRIFEDCAIVGEIDPNKRDQGLGAQRLELVVLCNCRSGKDGSDMIEDVGRRCLGKKD
jgi:hypothetical protein